MAILYLVIFALSVCVGWYIAKQFSEVAKAKGYHDSKYFWICFLLSWVGYLLVIALPDRGNIVSMISDELPDL